VDEQVGVTLWRLRPSKEQDAGLKFPVKLDSGATEMWRAERAGAETRFAPGDRVRLSIESPRNGYLYVIDREQYSDSTLGDAMMVFPAAHTRNGENFVTGGVVIEIPDQGEQWPYFLLKSDNPRYRGELLTVIVSPERLPGLTPASAPLPISRLLVNQWEELWGTEAGLYEESGGAGRAYTNAEKQAGSSGIKSRQLTREDPVPQTIYRVRVSQGETILIPVRIELGI
jgi:hypothetical protein